MIEMSKSAILLALAVMVGPLVAGCNPPSAASSTESTGRPALPESRPTAENSAKAEHARSDGVATGANETVETTQITATAEPASAPKANRPPRADRLPQKPGEAEKITFDDLNLQMLPNIVFRPFMVNERVKELEGKRVSISGYMHGGAAGSSGIKKFVLLKNTECKFGKDGQADHLAMVYLKNGSSAEYTRSDIKVEGTLRIEPFTGDDGNTWSIYNLEDAQIR
jgi:hypothetical protein